MIAAIVIIFLLTGGCININTRLQPEDPSVKEVLRGTDCVPMFLGLGFGTATIENALAQGQRIGDARASYHPITKVRRVESSEQMALIFGARCVEVVGE